MLLSFQKQKDSGFIFLVYSIFCAVTYSSPSSSFCSFINSLFKLICNILKECTDILIYYQLCYLWGASLVAQLVKNLPAMQEILVHLLPGSGRSTGEGIGYPLQYSGAFLVAQLIKNLPEMWETWVRSLSWEDPLDKGTATHSSILVWRIPLTI